MPKANFTGGLLQLCNPKFKVLNKEVKKPTLDDKEKIALNLAFKNNNIKVIVIPVKSKVEKENTLTAEQKKNLEGVNKERNQIL